jgi:hypothetical protein
MPVPQAGTATTVASTGTYDVARFGIEDGVCGTRRRSSTPRADCKASPRPMRVRLRGERL